MKARLEKRLGWYHKRLRDFKMAIKAAEKNIAEIEQQIAEIEGQCCFRPDIVEQSHSTVCMNCGRGNFV